MNISNSLMYKNPFSFLSFFKSPNSQNPTLEKGDLLYKSKTFSISYPATWQVLSDKEILNFFPPDKHGVVTVSSYSKITFLLEKTRNFILEMNGIDDDPEMVQMMQKENSVEFLYEHVDKDTKWYTKAIRTNKDFHLLTISCDINKWNSEKGIFLKIIDSFKLNK